jgi:broad specificity phosphatase PhoE
LVTIGLLIVVLATVLCRPAAQASDRDAALWNALRSRDHIALLRHAIAPGNGDPPEFRLGDCKTQRNLSMQGRDQATRIGELFRAHGIQSAQIFSSQWCRCLETARLLGLGPVEERPFLNSFFNDYARREPQTRMLREWLDQQALSEPVVLVTHQVNITALTGVYPGSGELVIVRRSETGDLTVVGTIETN